MDHLWSRWCSLPYIQTKTGYFRHISLLCKNNIPLKTLNQYNHKHENKTLCTCMMLNFKHSPPCWNRVSNKIASKCCPGIITFWCSSHVSINWLTSSWGKENTALLSVIKLKGNITCQQADAQLIIGLVDASVQQVWVTLHSLHEQLHPCATVWRTVWAWWLIAVVLML